MIGATLAFYSFEVSALHPADELSESEDYALDA